MIGLLFIIFLTVMIICIVVCVKTPKEETGEVCAIIAIISGIISAILLIIVFIMIYDIGTEFVIDNKIANCKERNAIIEKSVDDAVKGHMEFESNTYEKLKDKDSMNLVSLFPDLKSDKLVQSQIKLYIKNNKKIESLQNEKINLGKTKWLLYFGK